jgi:hypothetical protein
MNPKELGRKLRQIFAEVEATPNPFDPPPDPKRPNPHRARPTFFESMDLYFNGPRKKVNERR